MSYSAALSAEESVPKSNGKKVITLFISAHGSENTEVRLDQIPSISNTMLQETRILTFAGTLGTQGQGLGDSRTVVEEYQRIEPEYVSVPEVEMDVVYKEFYNNHNSTYDILNKLSVIFKKIKYQELKHMGVFDPENTRTLRPIRELEPRISPSRKSTRKSVKKSRKMSERSAPRFKKQKYQKISKNRTQPSMIDLQEDYSNHLIKASVLSNKFCDIIKPIYERTYQIVPNQYELDHKRVHYGIHVVDIRNYPRFNPSEIVQVQATLNNYDVNNINTYGPFKDYLLYNLFGSIGQRKEIKLSVILYVLQRMGFDAVNIIDPSCRDIGMIQSFNNINDPVAIHTEYMPSLVKQQKISIRKERMTNFDPRLGKKSRNKNYKKIF